MLKATITINGENYDLYDDLHCFVKKFMIGSASPILNMVEVPYRNGALDMTEAVADGVRYKNRTISLPLRIDDEEPLEIYDVISNLVSGKECKLTLNDDEYYYKGRAIIEDLQTDKFRWDFKLSLDAYPYRMKDKTVTYSSPATKTIVNNGIPVVPTIISDASFTVRVNGGTQYAFGAGSWSIIDFRLNTGSNTIVTTGDATITVSYTEKRL